MTRRIVPNFGAEGRPHAEQLKHMSEDCLKLMRANMTGDPNTSKTYHDMFRNIADTLAKYGDDMPTDVVKEIKAKVDVSHLIE
jgi:hypothetical protein